MAKNNLSYEFVVPLLYELFYQLGDVTIITMGVSVLFVARICCTEQRLPAKRYESYVCLEETFSVLKDCGIPAVGIQYGYWILLMMVLWQLDLVASLC